MTYITISDKNTSDQLTAAEFNQILDALKDGTRTIVTEAVETKNAAIVQTGTSGKGLYVARDLASGSTDDVVAYFSNDNTGDDKPCLQVVSSAVYDAFVAGTTQTTSGVAAALFDNSGEGASTNFVKLAQKASTGSSYFYRNLASADTEGAVVVIVNDNAGDDKECIYIVQDADAWAIRALATNDTSGFPTAYFGDQAQGAGTNFVSFAHRGDSDRSTAYIYRNLTSANTGQPVARIIQDNASDDQMALGVQQNGAHYAIYALKNLASDTTYGVINADNAAGGVNTSYSILGLYNSGNGSNFFYRNLAAVDTAGPVVKITQDNTGDDQGGLYLLQDGTGYGMFIYKTNADNVNGALGVDTSGGANERSVLGLHNSTAGTNRFYRNLASTDTAGPVVYIYQENASDDQTALFLAQAGTGYSADFRQNNKGVNADYVHFGRLDSSGSNLFVRDLASANTAGPVMSVQQANSGDDQPTLELRQAATGVGVMSFVGCTDKGTSHTTLAGSIQVFTPAGGTAYINLYT